MAAQCHSIKKLQKTLKINKIKEKNEIRKPKENGKTGNRKFYIDYYSSVVIAKARTRLKSIKVYQNDKIRPEKSEALILLQNLKKAKHFQSLSTA